MTDDLRELKRRLDEAIAKYATADAGTYEFNWLARKLMDAWPAISAALDRAVVLPVKVGDTVYHICKCEDIPTQLDGTMYSSDGSPGTATGYYCPYQDSDECPHQDADDCE